MAARDPHRGNAADDARRWVGVFRDVALVLIGGFLLIYDTVAVTEPNAIIVGAGLTCLGSPLALRWDEARRRGGSE